jgi:proteasome lid subunit RPN8/RPN11
MIQLPVHNPSSAVSQDARPHFEANGLSNSFSFRSISVFADFPCFFGDTGRLVIAPDAAHDLASLACAAAPAETGGLLCGRVLRDSAGPYTIVAGYAEASAAARRLGGVHISPEATSQLRDQAARAHPAADVIGWWHSHLGPSAYSAADRAHQRLWTDPYSVGLLVFSQHSGTTWGAAYLGPRAQPLPMYAAAVAESPALVPLLRRPAAAGAETMTPLIRSDQRNQ